MEKPGELQRMLDAAENASPVDAVEAVTRRLADELDAESISLLIADLSGRALVRLAHVPRGAAERRTTEGEEAGEPDRQVDRDLASVLPFDGGPHEQVMRAQRARVLRDDDGGGTALAGEAGWTVLAPVTERGETLGLLEVRTAAEPDGDAVAAIGRAGHLLGFVVIANRRHTDLFEWGQRSRPFTLSAEIQRRLLPSAFTCEAASFTLSAWLEPAASVGGDTFDYSVARDVLHLSITDAMGHGVGSALTATLCVGALRTARRRGLSLAEQVAEADAAVADHPTGDGESFVTGLFGRVDLASGELTLVNAGHVAPYLARDGDVSALDLPDGLPLGLFPDTTRVSTVVRLLPGDRLVFVTDGMVERNAADFALPQGIGDTCALHPREAVRFLADAVLEATGHELADDATLLVLDWHGEPGGPGGPGEHGGRPGERSTSFGSGT